MSRRLERSPLVAVTLAGILAGCASRYEPPSRADVPTARLRVVQRGTENTEIQHLNASCLPPGEDFLGKHFRKISRFSGISDDSDMQRLHMPAPPPPDNRRLQYTEIAIDASKPFNLGYNSFAMQAGAIAVTSSSCLQGMTFQPRKDSLYEAAIERAGSRCTMRLMEIVPDGSDWRRTPVFDVQPLQACTGG